MITYPYGTIAGLLQRLREAEARECGMDDKANNLRRKVEALYRVMPHGASLSLTEEELKGVLL